jgi:hypothetical protein
MQAASCYRLSCDRILDARRIPSPAAQSHDPARGERSSYIAQGVHARLLNFCDDRPHVAGGAIGFGLDCRDRVAARGLDLRIAELDALRLRRRQRR